MDLSNGMVVSIGIGTVFFGLICLVFICWLMSRVCSLFVKENGKSTPSQASPVVADNAPIANRQEIIAASCAVIAEEIGTDAKNIKVTSFKRV